MVVQYLHEPHWRRAGSAGGDNALRHIARTGKTLGGHTVWSEEERQTVRDLYPDYAALVRALPKRSFKAIKNEAADLGVVKRRHVWTNIEILTLRRLYARGATNAELRQAFPALREQQILKKAWHMRMPRRRRRYITLGVPALDTIRLKATQHGLTLVDLDALARTRRYFQSTSRHLMWKYIDRAVRLFDGQLVVDWSVIECSQVAAPYRLQRR